MNRVKKYIQNKLYGKYYPVNEDTKDIFLEEHKNYFRLMIKKEQLYLLIGIELEYHQYKNINDVTRKTAPLREQVKNLEMIIDKLSYEGKNEITLDDIKYVYGLTYFRRKQELIKFIILWCILIGSIIFLYCFIKDRI
mgnify:CR=1 FL=1